MGIDRRTVLRLLAGGLLTGAPLGLPLSLGAAPGGRIYLSPRAGAGGRYRASGFRASGARGVRPEPSGPRPFLRRPAGPADGRALRPTARPLRPGHRPGARRRGQPSSPPPATVISTATACSAATARFLYASENDFDGERGVIGVYDADKGYARAGELASHGIGPHEIELLSDGATLVIANGGILTRPDLPRIKLNVTTMAPSLCYVDRRDGRLLQERRLAPALHQLGIRHLAVGRDDTVAVAMQYEGPRGDLVPLVAVHRTGAAANAPLLPLNAPAAVWRAMKQYCGSVCFDSSGRILAVSAPRGDLVTCWDAGAGIHVSSTRVRDGSGIAPGERPGEFLASSGHGGVTVIEAWSGRSTPLDTAFVNPRRWDNHLVTRLSPRYPLRPWITNLLVCVKRPTSGCERLNPRRGARHSGNPGVLEGRYAVFRPLQASWIRAFAGHDDLGGQCLARMESCTHPD